MVGKGLWHAARQHHHQVAQNGLLQNTSVIVNSLLSGSFLIKSSSLSAPTKIEELTAESDKKTQRSPAGNRTQGLANSSLRPWVRFPAGLRCVFSSDPAVSSSIFVGAEREEDLTSVIIQFCTVSADTFVCDFNSNICKMLPLVTFVLARGYRHWFKFGRAALLSKSFFASHPERPPFLKNPKAHNFS